MPLNGTELIEEPFNTTFSPFTDFFDAIITGGGMLFWLIPLTVLTLAIYVKTESSEMATLFMIGSGALLSGGGIFIGSPEMSIVFIVFTALGIAGLFMSLFFQRR